MEIAEKKIHLFHPLPRASRIRGTRRLNPELGVVVWRRVDVSLYACRKRCPGAEARETRGRHGRRVERITNMTSILRQTGGEAITVGGVRPSTVPRASLPRDSRATHADFELWLCRNKGKQRKPGRQAGRRPCFVYVLCGTNWCPLTRYFAYTPILIRRGRWASIRRRISVNNFITCIDLKFMISIYNECIEIYSRHAIY